MISASFWPVADLVLANGQMRVSFSFVFWPLGILLFVALAVVGLAPLVGTWQRAAAIVAPAAILFFSFSALEPVLRHGLAAAGLARGVAVAFTAIWLGTSAMLARAATGRDGVQWLLAFPILALASTVAFAAAEQRWRPSAAARPITVPMRFATRPNVYHFLFDGMGRPDVLKSVLHLDIGPGPSELARRGFVLPPGVEATQLATIPSITTMLVPGTAAAGARDIDIAASPVAQVFRANGYRVAQYGEVFTFAACKGQEDICLSNFGLSLSEFDIAIVRRTPIYPVVSRYLLAATSSRGLFANLNNIASTPRPQPTFTFAYMVPPHPPFIFGKDCRADLTDENDFRAWRHASIPRYGQAYRCVMQALLPAVDRIITRDPNAVILVSGDHGTMFLRSQTSDRPWSAASLAERRPVLVAARAPARCRDDLGRIGNLTELYPRLFDCLVVRGPD